MAFAKIGVVGAGTMGQGIGQTCAAAGIEVVVTDVAQAQLERAGAAIAASLERLDPARKREAGRGAFGRVRSTLRTASAPSARLYGLIFGRLLGALYARVAEDVDAALAAAAAPDVLEIGPGPGGLAVRIATRRPDLRLTGLDIDPIMVRLAADQAAASDLGGRLDFLVGDVAALPFDDASFDLVISTFSTHHWAEPGRGFAEIRRVLRPAGRVIVYDLHERWTKFETRSPGIADAAVAGGFERAEPTRIRWPGPLALVLRLELVRPGSQRMPVSKSAMTWTEPPSATETTTVLVSPDRKRASEITDTR